MKNNQSCEKCIYFLRNSDSNYLDQNMGQCRRFPTEMYTSVSHWCGEYKSKDYAVVEGEEK